MMIITIKAPWDHGGEAPMGRGILGGRADLLFLRQQWLRAGTEKLQMLPRRKGVAALTIRERALPLAMCLHLSPSQTHGWEEAILHEDSTFWFTLVFSYCSLTLQHNKIKPAECFNAWSFLCLQPPNKMSTAYIRLHIFLQLHLHM